MKKYIATSVMILVVSIIVSIISGRLFPENVQLIPLFSFIIIMVGSFYIGVITGINIYSTKA